MIEIINEPESEMRPKKISYSDLIGDRGIALIHSIVGDMGFVWNATGLEAGIDGYIEIRDSITGIVTNQIIQVQSKATNNDFQAETKDGFDYYCDARDIDYWLGGNAPVILIVSRPRTNEAYWVFIKDYFKEISKRGTRKVHFDKKEDKLDVNSRDALISLSKPKDSGIYLPPIPKREKLYSNLLEVTHFPDRIYIGYTDFRFAGSLWRKFKEMGVEVGGEWILKEKKITSFYNLEEYPWCDICDEGTIESFGSDEWAFSEDIDFERDFVRLLNLCLSAKLATKVKYCKDKEYYFFVATQDLSPRELRYKSKINKTKRTVFQSYLSKKDQERISYYRHSAFIGKFIRLDNKWYLEITPTYHYTSDGYKRYYYGEDLLKGIKQIERNPAVLGQVIMWADYLKEQGGLFVKPYHFIKLGQLANFDLDDGIDDNAWLRNEEIEESETAKSSINELPLFSAMD